MAIVIMDKNKLLLFIAAVAAAVYYTTAATEPKPLNSIVPARYV
jgi:hypothetical protein